MPETFPDDWSYACSGIDLDGVEVDGLPFQGFLGNKEYTSFLI